MKTKISIAPLDENVLKDLSSDELLSLLKQSLYLKQPDQRELDKRTRERARMARRKDLRVTYDLPSEIKQKIKEIAEEHAVPASQIATLALAQFIVDYENGHIDPGEYKQPSQSPRYEWNLVFPKSFLLQKSKNKNPKSRV